MRTVHVVHAIDASYRIEHPVQVRRVRHFEDEAADRQARPRGLHRCGQNIHVMLAEHPRDVEQQPGPVEGLDLDLHQEDALER